MRTTSSKSIGIQATIANTSKTITKGLKTISPSKIPKKP